MDTMDIDIFAQECYGKIALERMQPCPPNFRLYSAGWLGKGNERQCMEIKGAEFRASKAKGKGNGKLCVKIPNSDKTAYVTIQEMDAYKKAHSL